MSEIMNKETLSKYTFEYLLQEALNLVPETVDKREGSIIYDALAPACYVMAAKYMDLMKVFDQTYVLTANGENLDKRVAEQGLTREKETHAVKLGKFESVNGTPMFINLGSRFQTMGEESVMNYTVMEVYTTPDDRVVEGTYRLRCETAGTRGNVYVGELLPISYINGLYSAIITETLIPAQDNETDDNLRERYVQKVNNRAFAGNVAQYDQEVRNLDGVGEVQVYPTWNGGGTVKLSVVDSQFNAVSTKFMQHIGEIIDPENYKGNGIGLAPIGAKVTIATPTVVKVNIDATVKLESGTNISQVQDPINNRIVDYINELKASWGVSDERNHHELAVYIAKIMSAILSVQGVSNVQDVKINGKATDLHLEQTALKQELPQIGTVVLTNG